MMCVHQFLPVLRREDIGMADGFVPLTDRCLVGVFSPRCSPEHWGLLLEVTSQKLAGALSGVPVFRGLVQVGKGASHCHGAGNKGLFHASTFASVCLAVMRHGAASLTQAVRA